MSKLCVSCKDAVNNLVDKMFSQDSQIIPDWFKRIGNYSLLPPPINKNPRYNYYLNRPQTHHPNHWNIRMATNVSDILPGITDTYVFFWAANKRNYDQTGYLEPAKAYGQFRNCGVSWINSQGRVVFKFNSPKPYQYQGNKYPPHLHFVYLKPDLLWDDVCSTIIVTPNLKLRQFKRQLKSGKYLVICALPERLGFPIIRHTHRISFETPVGQVDAMVRQYQLADNLQVQNIPKTIPIIVYCRNSECDASDQLIIKLRRLQYINILTYRGGIEQYYDQKFKVSD